MLTLHPELTLDALRAAPSVLIQQNAPGGLELAVRDAVRTLAQQQSGLAIFLVAFGAERAPPWREPVAPVRALSIDERGHEVVLDGRSVNLTFKEFALLNFLFTHRAEAFSRESLVQAIWGERYHGGLRTVDIHVRRVRKKLSDEVIDTVRGIGYRFGRSIFARVP
ncbi:MAG TPA: winged helix-turn-helix domain-containing protein [Polyangiales bacterium]